MLEILRMVMLDRQIQNFNIRPVMLMEFTLTLSVDIEPDTVI